MHKWHEERAIDTFNILNKKVCLEIFQIFKYFNFDSSQLMFEAHIAMNIYNSRVKYTRRYKVGVYNKLGKVTCCTFERGIFYLVVFRCVTNNIFLFDFYSYYTIQWGQYVFDPLANYENWLLVEKGTAYNFTHLFI